MDELKFGTLKRGIDLRSIWPNEGHFSEWLANPKSINMLAETLNLEFELVGRENPMGDFRADIVCKDTTDDSWVVIENQLEQTNHDHLGKLLAYSAVRKATTVIWIAKTFREEHRATLDWLNEITSEERRFFGLEIELMQIDDSRYAPHFNITSKPNDWSRSGKKNRIGIVRNRKNS